MAGKPQESARCGSYARVHSAHQLREAWAVRQDRAETAFHTENGKRYATAKPHFGRQHYPKPINPKDAQGNVLTFIPKHARALSAYERI